MNTTVLRVKTVDLGLGHRHGSLDRRVFSLFGYVLEFFIIYG